MAFADFYSSELPENVQLAIQTLYAQLRAFTQVSFNEDGTLIPAPPGVGLSPIGTISMYGGASDPPTWLICDGRQISRVTYSSLFNAIGTQFGAGDGSTTFNIPDLRQRFPLGKSGAGTGAILGSTGGAIDHTHTSGTITISGSTGSSTVTITGSTASGTSGSGGDHDHGASTGSEATHTHTYSGTTGVESATQMVDVTNPSVVVAFQNHTHNYSGTTSAGSAHAHSISASGTHVHGIPALGAGTLAGASHSHTSGTLAASSSDTGTANPPFQTVNFIILAGV